MTKSMMNPKVNSFISKAPKWQEEMEQLRTIILCCGLTEELKWGKPCYMYEEHNIVVIQGFKEYCALLFFKGMLLKDTHNILVKTGENTRVGRQVRFTGVKEIGKQKTVLKQCILEAIEVEKSGLKVPPKKNVTLKLPEEFQHKLEEYPALKTAFKALTPGRQRAYIIYFSAAKQSQTRASRIENSMSQILQGKGLNDR